MRRSTPSGRPEVSELERTRAMGSCRRSRRSGLVSAAQDPVDGVRPFFQNWPCPPCCEIKNTDRGLALHIAKRTEVLDQNAPLHPDAANQAITGDFAHPHENELVAEEAL